MRMAVVLCIFLTYGPSRWNQARGQAPAVGVNKTVIKPPNRSARGDQSRGGDERGSKERPFVVDTKGHQDTPAEASDAKAEKDHARYIERKTLFYAGLTAWATFGLCFIGVGGIIAAVWTLRTIRTQVLLQTKAMTQWVDLKNWKTALNSDNPTYRSLYISVELINPTQFPLKIPKGIIRIFASDRVRSEIHLRDNHLLTPHNPYIVWTTTTIAGEDGLEADRIAKYHFNNLRLRVQADLSHIGVLGNREKRLIEGVLCCGKDTTVFEERTRDEDLLDRSPEPN